MFLKYNIQSLKNPVKEITLNSSNFSVISNDETKVDTYKIIKTNHGLFDGNEIYLSYDLLLSMVNKNDEKLDVVVKMSESCKVFDSDDVCFYFNFAQNKGFFLEKKTESKDKHVVEIKDGYLKNIFYNYTLKDDYELIINFEYKGKIVRLKWLSGNLFSLTINDGSEDDMKIVDDVFYASVHYLYVNNIKANYIYYILNYISIPIGISSNINNGLNNEDNAQLYFNEKKKELIPDIIDYEKQCFIPYHNGKPLYGIKYNLFFRDRDGDYKKWNSNDNLFWNQSYSSSTQNADFLGKLGFTDEDIFYRKLKVQKSFLRLSFYDSKNPFKQNLLFYSTIFLDSGELYGEYIKNIDKKNGSNLVDTCTGLTCSFNVFDKFHYNKSSEGFYLYLFPNNLKDSGVSETIYMRVEFNHAGYGKTIPLMSPTSGNTAIDFGDNNFPTFMISDNGNNKLDKYFDYLHIPITLKKENNEYVYVFNTYFKKDDSDILTINLYEPKLNESKNGSN